MYFTFITIQSKRQAASALLTRLQVFISEGIVRIIFILSQFQELSTGRLVRASASSVLREGDLSHMGNMTQCSRGSPGGSSLIYLLRNLYVYKYQKQDSLKKL